MAHMSASIFTINPVTSSSWCCSEGIFSFHFQGREIIGLYIFPFKELHLFLYIYTTIITMDILSGHKAYDSQTHSANACWAAQEMLAARSFIKTQLLWNFRDFATNSQGGMAFFFFFFFVFWRCKIVEDNVNSNDSLGWARRRGSSQR